MRTFGMSRQLCCLGVAVALLAGCSDRSDEPAGGSGGTETVEADYHTLKTPPLAPGQFEMITRAGAPVAPYCSPSPE